MTDPWNRTRIPAGAYAQRERARLRGLDRVGERVVASLLRPWRCSRVHTTALVRGAESRGAVFSAYADGELQEAAAAVRRSLRRRADWEGRARSFALACEAARRGLGAEPVAEERFAAAAALEGRVCELGGDPDAARRALGLAACASAIGGAPVHVLCSSDARARAQLDAVERVARPLGLSVGLVGTGSDRHARSAAYRCAITCAPVREVAFDYLKDRLALGAAPAGRARLTVERLHGEPSRAAALLLRGLGVALLDEADRLLLDLATAPLTLSDPSASGPAGGAVRRRAHEEALALAELLLPGHDFVFDEAEQRVRLTDWGGVRLLDLARPLGGAWLVKAQREDRMERALLAQRLLARDRHYRVVEGRIRVLDPGTGAELAERVWPAELAELVAIKEGLPSDPELDVRARMSLTTFFRRYLQLGGVCAAAQGAQDELWEVHRLPLLGAPRADFQERLFATSSQRDDALAICVRAHRGLGAAVVVAARTPERAAELARQLREQRIPCESEPGAALGRGAVLVISSADADPAPVRAAADARGLFVVLAERHRSPRHDRQLLLRLARGAPLRALLLASLEDSLFEHARAAASRLASLCNAAGLVRPFWLARLACAYAQRGAQAPARGQRRYLEALDEHLEAALGFAGRAQ